jgi:hypothetical protein
MILNSKYNDFIFKFPPNFFTKEIVDKYDPFIKRLKMPYNNLVDYINFTVQSVSWPSISTETVEQFSDHGVRYFPGGWNLQMYTSKELIVTFKTTESYINYFIMYDLLEYYWQKNKNKESISHLPSLHLMLLDRYGYLLVTFQYDYIVFSGLSELELSYASNVPEFRTFTASFKADVVKAIREYDNFGKIKV